jgi:hypothetical protein
MCIRFVTKPQVLHLKVQILDISSILQIFVCSIIGGRMLCHMVTLIVISKEIWMKENPPLVMLSPLELHLPNKKVSFKMKLLNLVLKQNIAP